MVNRALFILSAIGIVLGLLSAYVYSQHPSPQPPVFNPAANPYAAGIYAVGIVESDQANGENVNLYPEVSGTITQILVTQGASVTKGTPLLTIDDTVQRATTEQQQLQAEAAQSALEALKAQPRPETLEVAYAQIENAKAILKNAQDQLGKLEKSYDLAPKSVSRDTLDNARNAAKVAATNLQVVERQYALTKAGAWSYDIASQEKQYAALSKAAAASNALLAKYTILAPIDGVVLSIQAAVGSNVSSQGAYGSYTQGFGPLITMGTPQDHLQVRAFIDEILVHRLPDPAKIKAQMFIRGTDIHVPLTFVGLQPYVSPKIELSDQRQERVDVRVLPILFRFDKPKDVTLYPGQLVDVYVGE